MNSIEIEKSFNLNKLATNILLNILSGAIEKKATPGNHVIHFKKHDFALNSNRLFNIGDPNMLLNFLV